MRPKTSKKVPSSERRPKVSLVIAPNAERDMASVKSAIKGWIVPLLVREFLAEQRSLSTETEVSKDEATTKPMGKEDVASSHIN